MTQMDRVFVYLWSINGHGLLHLLTQSLVNDTYYVHGHLNIYFWFWICTQELSCWAAGQPCV